MFFLPAGCFGTIFGMLKIDFKKLNGENHMFTFNHFWLFAIVFIVAVFIVIAAVV